VPLVAWCRCVPVPRDSVRDAPRHRILPDPGLRAVDPHRDPVVGVVLDQRRRVTGARLARPAHGPHDHHDERRRPVLAAARLLHQGDRRLDDRLSVCPSVRLSVCPRGSSRIASIRSSPVVLDDVSIFLGAPPTRSLAAKSEQDG